MDEDSEMAGRRLSNRREYPQLQKELCPYTSIPPYSLLASERTNEQIQHPYPELHVHRNSHMPRPVSSTLPMQALQGCERARLFTRDLSAGVHSCKNHHTKEKQSDVYTRRMQECNQQQASSVCLAAVCYILFSFFGFFLFFQGIHPTTLTFVVVNHFRRRKGYFTSVAVYFRSPMPLPLCLCRRTAARPYTSLSMMAV